MSRNGLVEIFLRTSPDVSDVPLSGYIYIWVENSVSDYLLKYKLNNGTVGTIGTTGTPVTQQTEACPFGAKSDTLGNFLIANGKSSDADDSSKTKTRHSIVADGKLIKLAYQTKDGTTSTQMKIHINGSVEATVVLANLSGTAKSGVETIDIDVLAGDYVEIEWDASDKPGECIMKFLQELS